MSGFISKIRAKKTKSREKSIERGIGRLLSLRENNLSAICIALFIWAVSIILIHPKIVSRNGLLLKDMLPLTGDSIFLLLGLIGAGIFLKLIRPEMAKRNSNLFFCALACAISMFMAKIIFYLSSSTMHMIPSHYASFLLPFALTPLVVTLLLDGAVGIIIGFWTCLVISLMAGRDFSLFLTGTITTVAVAYTATEARNRLSVFKSGVIAGFVQIACMLGVITISTTLPDLNFNTLLHQAGACVISGVISAVIAIIILPVMERIFRLTSNITLLELSDLAHPLLQRLAMEAPGTYHHSIMVASLAQSAAEEIGANSLLARICAYYHDIGKMTKPEYFAENIHMQEDPHNNLAPSMSTLIIISHVKEGISLAMLHRLPEIITRVISEHHGTSLIRYFHHKAKTQLEFEYSHSNPDSDHNLPVINDNDFRYPGPKPSTRESVIISLADAVEAASRTMEKVTAGHIEELVNEVTNTRLADDQLSEADISLAELSNIKRSFVFSLSNMLHARIPYPKDENINKQSTETD